MEFSYLGDRMNIGGGSEASVAFGTRIGWVQFRECRDLLSEKSSSENQWNCMQKLCEFSNALWKRDMVLRSE